MISQKSFISFFLIIAVQYTLSFVSPFALAQ